MLNADNLKQDDIVVWDNSHGDKFVCNYRGPYDGMAMVVLPGGWQMTVPYDQLSRYEPG